MFSNYQNTKIHSLKGAVAQAQIADSAKRRFLRELGASRPNEVIAFLFRAPVYASRPKIKISKKAAKTRIADPARRHFLKVLGALGLGAIIASLLGKKAQALVFGSMPGPGVVGLKNASDTRINPATEETLAAIKNNYAFRLDDTSTANVIYIGKAELTGFAIPTSSSVWQIKKINTSSGVVVTWADGDENFNNIWDNRTSLTYN